MKVEWIKCYDQTTNKIVEIPSKLQNTPEIKAAKQKEIEYLMKYNVFEVVKDRGQERIASKWVITQK